MNRQMAEGSLGAGTQASPAVVSNVIPFIRRNELFLENIGVHNRQRSANAGGLDRSSMKRGENISPGFIMSGPALRRDKVDRLRQRLLTGLYNISPEQIAKGMLKKQLLADVVESRKSQHLNVSGTSMTWSRSPETDQAS